MALPQTIREYEELGLSRLWKFPTLYYMRGADDEQTAKDSENAFLRYNSQNSIVTVHTVHVLMAYSLRYANANVTTTYACYFLYEYKSCTHYKNYIMLVAVNEELSVADIESSLYDPHCKPFAAT